eukprot:g51572.t1
MAEPIEGEFVLWLTVRMHSKTVKANPRYFFAIQRAVFEECVHMGCITMFEEAEATMATGVKSRNPHRKSRDADPSCVNLNINSATRHNISTNLLLSRLTR